MGLDRKITNRLRVGILLNPGKPVLLPGAESLCIRPGRRRINQWNGNGSIWRGGGECRSNRVEYGPGHYPANQDECNWRVHILAGQDRPLYCHCYGAGIRQDDARESHRQRRSALDGKYPAQAGRSHGDRAR